MSNEAGAPLWLQGALARALALGLLAALGVAGALGLGAADPPRAGPLRWEDDFKAGMGRWAWLPPPGGWLGLEGGALMARLGGAGPDFPAVGLTTGPEGDYTFEVAGAAAGGNGAAYGLVFGWQDAAHYSAVLINANGYAEAFTRAGDGATAWYAWQQWPHILVGAEANRVRVDVRGRRVTLRINDELLAEGEAAQPHGRLGVIARSAEPGEVVFSWARLWSDAPLSSDGL
jgi:hypothetical protein